MRFWIALLTLMLATGALAQSTPALGEVLDRWPSQYLGYSKQERDAAFFELIKKLDVTKLNGMTADVLVQFSAIEVPEIRDAIFRLNTTQEKLDQATQSVLRVIHPRSQVQIAVSRFSPDVPFYTSLLEVELHKTLEGPSDEDPDGIEGVYLKGFWSSRFSEPERYRALLMSKTLGDASFDLNRDFNPNPLRENCIGTHRLWHVFSTLEPKTELDYLALAYHASRVFRYRVVQAAWWESGIKYQLSEQERFVTNWALAYFLNNKAVSPEKAAYMVHGYFAVPFESSTCLQRGNNLLPLSRAAAFDRLANDPEYFGIYSAVNEGYATKEKIVERILAELEKTAGVSEVSSERKVSSDTGTESQKELTESP
ncbi:MAG: hypothetical protein KDB07_12295, partial [Planctomycetes bacterium]|nr:hypothetical protein [Planctomycetota bacterium]